MPQVKRTLRSLPLWALVGLVALLAATGGAVALAAGVPGAPDAAPAPAAAQPAQQVRGQGSDPLTPAEEAEALAALASLQGARAAAMRSAPATAGAAAISAPAESVLLVERKEEEKGAITAAGAGGAPPRRADLYLYRYADDVLVHAVHDLQTGETAIVEEARGVQLPLTAEERALATELAFADPALFEFMQAEHRQIVGEELSSPAQVDVRAFVYHSGAAPEIEPPEAAACGIQRCAQLLILTGNNVTYSVLPVVNLSTLRTASVIPLAVQDAQPAQDEHADHEHEEVQP